MTEYLNSYMQKIKEGDKDSFRFLATSLGNKMFATASKLIREWIKFQKIVTNPSIDI